MNIMDTYDIFRKFEEVVRGAGILASDYFNDATVSHEQKDDGTVVTEVDRRIEQALLAFIKEHFPDDTIVGEEHGSHAGKSGFVWHIDPIDGTDNFLRRIPFCATSVARLGDASEGTFGLVYNPITRHMFSTFHGRAGAFENERLCTLTAEPLGGKYVISIGRGAGEAWMKPATYALSAALGTKYGRCTTYHSTALELAYVAANRIDAFLTYGLKSYDYAAGLMLVQAAGGSISVFEKGRWMRWEDSLKALCSSHGRIIFASHPDIHDGILQSIGDPAAWANKGFPTA